MATPNDGDRDGNNGLPNEYDGITRGRGNPLDAHVTVSTGLAVNISETSALLEGSLDSLSGAGVAVGFEVRPASSEDWTATPTRIRSTPTTYERTVEDLSPGTDYEFRAVAYAGDTVATGGTARFSTESARSGPAVEHFEVGESTFPNDHAELTVEWSVSQAGGDLASVLIKVVDGDGFVVDAARSGASGTAASGVDYFRVENAAGDPLGVKLTVADDDGVTTTTEVGIDGYVP